ncbi:MAG: flagellar assembly protein FliH [Sideroxydans sp.]|nr:flagellar assembly protein FliH [Sideroxydans sp.]
MSDPINESLTAWQRWELPAFKSDRDLALDINLPTAAELEQLQQQSHDEGYQAGYTEGQQRGYADGMQQGLEEKQRLADIISVLSQQVDEAVSKSLMTLSLDIAQQVIQQALTVQPELLHGMVQEAISTLPVFNQSAHLFLHPDDAELVRDKMGETLSHSGWKILEDSRLERGGARLETASSQLDASVESRWDRVMAAMGQEAKWLVQK